MHTCTNDFEERWIIEIFSLSNSLRSGSNCYWSMNYRHKMVSFHAKVISLNEEDDWIIKRCVNTRLSLSSIHLLSIRVDLYPFRLAVFLIRFFFLYCLVEFLRIWDCYFDEKRTQFEYCTYEHRIKNSFGKILTETNFNRASFTRTRKTSACLWLLIFYDALLIQDKLTEKEARAKRRTSQVTIVSVSVTPAKEKV